MAGVSVDQRKVNAVRAYFEWQPIRQVDMDDSVCRVPLLVSVLTIHSFESGDHSLLGI